MKKEELLQKLQSEVVNLSFEKKDGTLRLMKCTKNLKMIGEEFHPKSEKPAKVDENGNIIESDLLVVFDLEKEGWRSFDYKNLKEVF